MCQIHKCHLKRQKFFPLMQEITLYFLRQNRLCFMHVWHSKPIKSQLHNIPVHTKNCEHLNPMGGQFLMYTVLFSMNVCMYMKKSLIKWFFSTTTNPTFIRLQLENVVLNEHNFLYFQQLDDLDNFYLFTCYSWRVWFQPVNTLPFFVYEIINCCTTSLSGGIGSITFVCAAGLLETLIHYSLFCGQF